MEPVDRAPEKHNWVGFEWDDALEQAAHLGIRLEQEITAPPRGKGEGTLRVVRQRESEGQIICTCAYEDWGDTRC